MISRDSVNGIGEYRETISKGVLSDNNILIVGTELILLVLIIHDRFRTSSMAVID